MVTDWAQVLIIDRFGCNTREPARRPKQNRPRQGVGEAKSMLRSILPECPRADKVPKELPTIFWGAHSWAGRLCRQSGCAPCFSGEGDRAEFVGIGRLT